MNRNNHTNQLDYFDFYSFEGEGGFRLKSCLVFLFVFWLKDHTPLIFVPFSLWGLYVTSLSLFLSFRKKCRYRGYFLYPNRIIHIFKEYEKEVDLLDFDGLATMGASETDNLVVRLKSDCKKKMSELVHLSI